jgi:hypothetical protein
MQPEIRYAQSGDVNGAYQVTGEGPFDVVPAPSGASKIDLAWGWRITTGRTSPVVVGLRG